MAIWKWKAVDDNRDTHEGIYEESEKATVLSYLTAQKLHPIYIRRSYLSLIEIPKGSLNHKQYWARSARQIGILLEAGIPLLMALDIIRDKEENLLLKSRWQKAIMSIQNGNEFSTGLQEFAPSPDIFLISMIKAGEKSGTLADCLLEAAKHLDEEVYFAKKIRKALFYPILLLIISLVIIYTLSIFVLPLYEGLFQGFEAELPFVTQALFGFGKLIPYIMFFGLILLLVLLYGRKEKSWVMPGTRQLRKYKTTMQICSILYHLLNAGTPLLSSLVILEQINKEKELSKLIVQLQFAVRNGQKLSPVFAASRYFPAEAASMLAVSEETGKFSEMLDYLSQIYRRELQEQWESYSRIIEPILVLGMAGMVALMAIGVLLPIFDIGAQIQ